MKAIILISLIIQMNILYAKDCHDCSVNKNADISSASPKSFTDISKITETKEEEKLRILLCAEAASGLGNWNRFKATFEEAKIKIEDYYIDNKCGVFKDRNIMRHSILVGGRFGVDFLEDFFAYLEKRQIETGDNTIIYRLINLTFDPERKTTLHDEFRLSGTPSNLEAIKMIEKYGGKGYNQLTEEEKGKGYYLEANQVAKK
jgi:hypothetical protein